MLSLTNLVFIFVYRIITAGKTALTRMFKMSGNAGLASDVVIKPLLLLLLSPDIFCGQVIFTKLPAHFQMFARDEANTGHAWVEGAASGETTLIFSCYEAATGMLIQEEAHVLGPGQMFAVDIRIPAKLREHTLKIFQLRENSDTLLKNIQGLLAGDFFIVSGQSNAECPWSEGVDKHDSIYAHPCIRSLGRNFSWATAPSLEDSLKEHFPIDLDCQFFPASSIAWGKNGTGFSGIWAVKLQHDLAITTGIPNCVVNGAIGGTSIDKHQASHTPSQPHNLRAASDSGRKALSYDRTFKKLYVNDALKGVKGIFWYQGETDATFDEDSARHYDDRFGRLYNSWKADFPNLSKIFVMQINTTCAGDQLSLIREIQRKLPEKYTDVCVMSTVGSGYLERAGDNCHYTIEGYCRIASKLVPAARKYLYGHALDENLILPANVIKAYYSDSTTICLQFNKRIFAQQSCRYPLPDSGVAYIKNYFYADKGHREIKLDTVMFDNDKLFLKLEFSQSVSAVTYLPPAFTKISSGYAGPWILNDENRELGAYSFFELPVQKPEAGKPDPDGVDAISLSPNPVLDLLTIEYPKIAARQITVKDLSGRMVINHRSDSDKDIISLSRLQPGLYTVEIVGENELLTKKILITGE